MSHYKIRSIFDPAVSNTKPVMFYVEDQNGVKESEYTKKSDAAARVRYLNNVNKPFPFKVGGRTHFI
jgi:hypothetical protein